MNGKAYSVVLRCSPRVARRILPGVRDITCAAWRRAAHQRRFWRGLMFRSDSDIQNDIIAELKWEPSLRNDDIAVAVRDGIVTLAGFVDSYADKWQAERAASKVKGVKAVANDIEVKLPSGCERPDPDIARAAIDALKWNISVPSLRVWHRRPRPAYGTRATFCTPHGYW
jgi:BON domain